MMTSRDGGVGLQMWRVAANILNKHSLTAVNLEIGGGLTTASP
jgi:hypothetical protein